MNLKHCIFYVLFTVIASLGFVWKAVAVEEENVPAQSFQQANDQELPQQRPDEQGVASMVRTQQIEKSLPLKSTSSLKEIQSQDRMLQQQPSEENFSLDQHKQKNTDNISAVRELLDPNSIAGLQAELMQLNQNNLQFRQQIAQRLLELNANCERLQQQMENLGKAVILLNQELIQLKQSGVELLHREQEQPLAMSATTTATVPSTITSLSTPSKFFSNMGLEQLKQILKLMSNHFSIVIGLSAFLLLLFFMFGSFWLWQRNKKKNYSSDFISEGEYDYMGSTESIPAKINLARTYIAMEDRESAREVLKEVLRLGNERQRKEAAELLKEIPVDS